VNAAHWLSAGEIATAYRTRAISPVALLEHLLIRSREFDPRLNVFIHIDAELALHTARLAEREIASGRLRSNLHGVPAGIKDIFDVSGLPTTCNSKLQLGHVASADAHVISRLRGAGAIILGKLGTHEFAIGGPSFDLPFAPPRNPWNREHHPGGSSSGSGSGLAAGLFPLALGSDTGGSVRHPASACGVVGLKPTYGLVSRSGVSPLSVTMDHVGPMARRVSDIAMLLDVLADYDPSDSGSVPAQARNFSQYLECGVRGLRIGVVRHFHETDMPGSPEVIAAVEQVAMVLAEEGASVSTVVLPPLTEFAALGRLIIAAEAWPLHADRLRSRPHDYGLLSRERLSVGESIAAAQYLEALRKRRQMITAVDEVFRDVDVLLTAGALEPPCRIEDTVEVARTHPLQAWIPFNVTGHPAISIMAGMSGTGLPLSAQLVGRSFQDAELLGVAAAYERATAWHDRHPPGL
jgi:aspartyl-tRNA(Asn)/glutamyl-tRNA(Gln) amidotransferase subunit A